MAGCCSPPPRSLTRSRPTSAPLSAGRSSPSSRAGDAIRSRTQTATVAAFFAILLYKVIRYGTQRGKMRVYISLGRGFTNPTNPRSHSFSPCSQKALQEGLPSSFSRGRAGAWPCFPRGTYPQTCFPKVSKWLPVSPSRFPISFPSSPSSPPPRHPTSPTPSSLSALPAR